MRHLVLDYFPAPLGPTFMAMSFPSHQQAPLDIIHFAQTCLPTIDVAYFRRAQFFYSLDAPPTLPHMLLRYSEISGACGPTPTHLATLDWWYQKLGTHTSIRLIFDVFPSRR